MQTCNWHVLAELANRAAWVFNVVRAWDRQLMLSVLGVSCGRLPRVLYPNSTNFILIEVRTQGHWRCVCRKIHHVEARLLRNWSCRVLFHQYENGVDPIFKWVLYVTSPLFWMNDQAQGRSVRRTRSTLTHPQSTCEGLARLPLFPWFHQTKLEMRMMKAIDNNNSWRPNTMAVDTARGNWQNLATIKPKEEARKRQLLKEEEIKTTDKPTNQHTNQRKDIG